MKKLLVLGAGTAGTTVVNKLSHELDPNEWNITIVDQDEVHYYQPGFLFIPFGMYQKEEVVKPKKRFVPKNIELIISEIELIEPEKNQVRLAKDGQVLDYDYLIIATGTHPRPDETPGMMDGEWRKSVHDFYTYEGSVTLAETLKTWEGGRLAVNIVEMPIKCPVAPLEFIFLADSYFQEKGIRDKVELTYVTPLPGAFTKPIAAKQLGSMLAEKNIKIVSEFNLEHVDAEAKKLISYEEEEVPYDLLVTVPVNMGAEVIERSGLGDELNHVPVDKYTFLSTKYDNIFALGDAANLPTSKAGSVAHFAVELFVENFQRHIKGEPMESTFDGHANCYVETGRGKALLIDFNYDVEPLPGKYPLPGLGPFSLLRESRVNHWGKLAFKWMYWNMLLKGRPIPIPAQMSMTGKLQEVPISSG